MPKKLYLHIGRAKAGSSAIQHFLYANQDKLLRQGFLYPRSPLFQKASHKLALIFQPLDPNYVTVAGKSIESIYRDFIKESQMSDCHSVIVSSENFFSVDPGLLKEFIYEHFDVKVICYVRRQDEILVSSLIQEIKLDQYELDVDIETYAKDPVRLKFMDYNSVIGNWEAVFGSDNIVVRVYGEKPEPHGIYSDFVEAIGCKLEFFALPELRVNPSPALDVLAFIKMINANAPSRAAANKIRPMLLEVSEKMGKLEAYESRNIVSNELKRWILNYFKESNSEVARKYLGRSDGVLFENIEIDDSAKPPSYQGMDIERLAAMIAAVQTQQQQEILELTVKLDNLMNN